MTATVKLDPSQPEYDLAEMARSLQARFPDVIITRGGEDLPPERAEGLRNRYGEWKSFVIPTSQGLLKGDIRQREIRVTSTANADPNIWHQAIAFCQAQRGELTVLIIQSKKLDESEPDYDQLTMLDQLRTLFPQMIVKPGDQLTLAYQRAEQRNSPEMIVRTLRRNAEFYGPAYAFQIPTPQGRIKGLVRRRDMSFISSSPVMPDEQIWNSIVEFCRNQRGKLETLD